MRFDRERFIDETAGDLGAALDIIDALTTSLNEYADADVVANMAAAGCYAQPHKEMRESLQKAGIAEYFAS